MAFECHQIASTHRGTDPGRFPLQLLALRGPLIYVPGTNLGAAVIRMPSNSQRSPGTDPGRFPLQLQALRGPRFMCLAPIWISTANASTPGPPVYVPGTNLGAPSTSKINNHHSTIINPSLEKPRGQSLISPSVFASLRLCVRSKDPRGGEGTPLEGFSPRRQARKGSDQTSPKGSRHEWHSNAIN
jgi:hypothetical protein